MATSEDLQDVVTAPGPLPVEVTAASPAQPTLHFQFLDLALDPLPNLKVRVSLGPQDKTYTTDGEGQIAGIQAQAGVRLRIAVQRFDGSYKQIEDAPMPASDATWNYISPQLVLETETQLHEGDPGQIEISIPKATQADEGDRQQVGAPVPLSTGTTSANQAPISSPQAVTVDSPMVPKSTPAHVALAAAPKAAPGATGSVPQASPSKAAKQPTVSGGNVAPARKSAQTTGRTAQGTPMAVLATRISDWWHSWTLPTINLWAHHGGNASSATTGTSSNTAPAGHGSKVPYSPSMLPNVQSLIQFAQEQTEYLYGKGEGTAAVVAQMSSRRFMHDKGEKLSITPKGRCYQYVRIALTRANIVEGFVADHATKEVQEAASLAGKPLLDKGFVDVTDEVPDARWAATGDVIVYSWSDAAWAKRRKKYGANVPNYGHIDIRSEDTYISDFVPPNGHPAWNLPDSNMPAGLDPSYVNVRIYRKEYDPRPTCRIRAFLACLREFETQAIKADADRYRALNTPLPSAQGQRLFNGFAAHPWSKFPKSTWLKGTSTASGAYQCTLETAEGFIKQRMLFDLEGHDLFTPIAQDRLAVMLMEEKGALPAVRKGDLDAAIKPILSTWASLPGASQNKGRKTADGKPMDMAYLYAIYEKFLAVELGKFGIVE